MFQIYLFKQVILLFLAGDTEVCEDHSPIIRLEDAFLQAAESGHFDCVKVFLEAGVDVNGTGSGYAGYDDITALMNASGIFPMIEPHHGEGGCGDCVKLLIEAGADVNRLGESGTTALMAPAFNGNSWILKMLLKEGAHVNVVDSFDNTALSLACDYFGDEACIKILLAAGADVDEEVNLVYLYKRAWGETVEDAGLEASDDMTTKSLKYLCRRTVRKHLLQMSPVNLFCQVPKLGLPNLLTRYLLYNLSLENEEEEID